MPRGVGHGDFRFSVLEFRFSAAGGLESHRKDAEGAKVESGGSAFSFLFFEVTRFLRVSDIFFILVVLAVEDQKA